MGTKLYIKTFGCQMNEYDSQKTVEILQNKKDMEVTTNVEEADIILLNTCSIREKAEDKVYSELGRLNKLKIKNPNIKIGVGGCVATQEGSNITKRAPYVDLIYGPQTLHKVSDLLDEDDKLKAIDITFPIEEKFDSLPEPTATSPSSFVAIMEGCSKYCSFCVVPYTRGDEVSRKAQQIFDEIARLVEQGTSEIVFVGQNVNSYKQVHDGRTLRLSDLIDIASNINGVDRIRFTTSHPLDMTDDLIEIFGSVPQLANQLHLPVQSGSDRILKAMKRNYTADLYRDIIERVKKIRPTIKVTSDFIVGFPGETDKDFQDTLRIVEEVKYAHAYSFKYSSRPGTPASMMENHIEEGVKSERLQILQDLIKQQTRDFNKSFEGKEIDVLIDKPGNGEDRLSGRSAYLQTVHMDGKASMIGKIIKAKVSKSRDNSLECVIS